MYQLVTNWHSHNLDPVYFMCYPSKRPEVGRFSKNRKSEPEVEIVLNEKKIKFYC